MCEGSKKCKPCNLKELQYRTTPSIFDNEPTDTESKNKRKERVANIDYNDMLITMNDLKRDYFTPSQFEEWWNKTHTNDDNKQFVYNRMSQDNLIHESLSDKILKEEGIYNNEMRGNTLRQLILSVENGYMNFDQINPTTILVDGYTIEANADGTFDVVNKAQVIGYGLTLDKVEEILELREEDEDKVWAQEMGLTESILKEYTADLTDEKRRYAKQVKDISVPRPRMAPRPKGETLPTKSYAVKQCGLYIQDEASYIIIDKYGFDKGYAAWENSIGNGGSMYMIAAQIANEKWVMCQALKLTDKLQANYFFRSYFDLWKQWSGYKAPTSLTQKKLANASAPVGSQNNPMKKPAAPASSKFDQMKKQIVPTSKDTMRVDDLLNKQNPIGQAQKMATVTGSLEKLIARGKEAEQKGRKDIAKIFYDKAKQLLGEVVKILPLSQRILIESEQDQMVFAKPYVALLRSIKQLRQIKNVGELSSDAFVLLDQINSLALQLGPALQDNTEARNN